MSDYETKTTADGFALVLNGKTVVTLTGVEGALKSQFPVGARDAAQDCFDKCFANSNGTTGAAHKCAKDCGLT